MHPAKLFLFLASFASISSQLAFSSQQARERTPVPTSSGPEYRPSAARPRARDSGSKGPFGSIEGSQPGDGFGWALQAAGDVNGDGFTDVLATAPFFDGDFVDEGAAWLFLGTSEGLSPAPVWSAFGGEAEARFGFSAGTAGDVDGNGLHDLIVGAPGLDLAHVDQGAAFVFLSAPGGVANDPSTVLTAAGEGASFGTSVAWAGDVNRDGFDDVLVGAPGFESGFQGEGAAFLFRGSPSGTPTTPVWTALGGQALAGFGHVVAPAGDIDADGFADLLVGAPLFDGQHADEGRVSVYAGSAFGPSLAPTWTLHGDQEGAAFGASAMTAGDVDGDGYADVVVGAPGRDGGEEDEGRALLHRGSARGLILAPAWMVDSGLEGGHAGASVATAGDVNGDGYADVLVGIPGMDGAGGSPHASGAVHSFHGSAQGLAQEPSEVWLGSELRARLGHAVASAGDLDGNGLGDVILGAPMPWSAVQTGRVVVVLGRMQLFKQEVSMQFPQGFHLIGDVNGDGYRDYTKEGLHLGTSIGPSEEAQWSPSQGVISATGDLNDDGYDDVIAWRDALDHLGYCDETDPHERVFVYYSSPAGLLDEPHVEIVAPLPCLGFLLEAAGDFDGDGFDDLIAADGRGGYSEDRRMYFHRGGPPPIAATATWQAAIHERGYGARSLDADGDGRMDLLFRSPSEPGRLLLAHGSATPPSFDEIFVPAFEIQGPWVLQDSDGDGRDDFGAFNKDYFYPEDQFYAVYPGRYGGSKSWRIYGHFSTFGAGLLSPLGDVNADGFSDFIASGNPRLFILGSTDGGRVIAIEELPNFSAAYAGDVNGDGFLDVVTPSGDLLFGNATRGRERNPRQVRLDGSRAISFQGTTRPFLGLRLEVQGLSAAGRERVQLEWQIQRVGHAFEPDTRRGSPWIDSGLPGDGGSRVLLSQPQTALNPGEIYKWRLRTISPHPFFPRSPWISLPHNNVNQAKFRAFGEGDCNQNGIPDAFDVIDGASADCESDGIPDECQVGIDCNGNGLRDSCDLASGLSLDCNFNFAPDDCELLSGEAGDCDLDGLLDECEIAAGASDCNQNGIPDQCDVSSGTSRDDNTDGVPDECATPLDADRTAW